MPLTDAPLSPQAIEASLNPFHAATSRPLLLLLNLLAQPKTTTSLPGAPAKAAPGPNVNVNVHVLPRTAAHAQVAVGYTDGKVEVIRLAGQGEGAAPATKKTVQHPVGALRAQRRQEQAMSIAQLVERVDAWARVLKAKEEATA